MKKVFKLLCVFAITATTIASCSKSPDVNIPDPDPEDQLALEKPIIEAYVTEHYPEAVQFEETGVWYEVLEAGEEDSYAYPLKDSLDEKWISVETIVNYTGKLVKDGSVFHQTEDLTKGDTLVLELGLTSNNKVGTDSWLLAFAPKKVTLEDETEKVLGFLFEKGAQNGAKFRVITPSTYYYGKEGNEALSVPANAPVDFEIEVLKVQDYVAETTEPEEEV